MVRWVQYYLSEKVAYVNFRYLKLKVEESTFVACVLYFCCGGCCGACSYGMV